MEVLLINQPRYAVNFAQFLPEKKRKEEFQLLQKVHNIAIEMIQFVGIVISSVFNAAYLALRYSMTSFTRIAFSYFGVSDFYLVAFRIGYWAFSTGFIFVTTAGRLFMKAYAPSNEIYLGQFLKDGVDPRHIQTKKIKLNTSEVPAEVKVKDLLDLYDLTNFTKADVPGYMPPTTRQEGETPQSVKDLRKDLKTFVNRVNERVAFLGTPPKDDIVRLNAFYQQIEDAVNFSIHKVTRDLESFLKENPDPQTSKNKEVVCQYKSLLENRARLVIDLSIAGKHCGARYMGEAMTSYFSFYGDTEPTGTLKDTLIELLAAKRNQMAQGEIQKHFGTSPHGFNKYMQNMGGILAIPGTESMIEHLSQDFNTATYLTSFFRVYDEDCIIDTIQEQIKKSGTFRGQIIDWLKEQVNEDWKPEGVFSPEEIEEKFKELIANPVDKIPMKEDIKLLIELLAYLKKQGIVLPELDEGWSNFIQDLFALSESRNWFDAKVFNKEVWPHRFKRQALAQTLSTGVLGKILEDKYSRSQDITLDEEIITKLKQLATVKKLVGHVHINEDTLMRVLQGEANLKEVIRDNSIIPIQSQFLAALNIEEIKEKGLSPVIMEWLLDFHQVFVPKNLEKGDISSIGVDIASAESYIKEVDRNQYNVQMCGSDPETIRNVFLPLIKEDLGIKRYIFGAETDIEEARNLIFEIGFKERVEDVIQAAERTLPAKASFYPLWKRFIYIKAPEMGAAIFRSTLFKVVTSAYVIFKLNKFIMQSYGQSCIWVDWVHYCLTKEASPQVTAAYRSASKVYSSVREYKWRLVIYGVGWIAQYVLNAIPHPLARRLAARIKPFSLFKLEGGYIRTLFEIVNNTVIFGWTTSANISSRLQSFADWSKQERLSISKKHCSSLWNKAIAVTA